MDLERVQRLLSRVSPRLSAPLFRATKRLPPVARRLEAEYAGIVGRLGEEMGLDTGPPATTRLPAAGRPRAEVLAALEGSRRARRSDGRRASPRGRSTTATRATSTS